MAKILGLSCKAYYNVEGVAGAETGLSVDDFTLAPEVTSVSIDGSRATADVSTRGGGSYRQKVGTLKEGSVSFDMYYDDTSVALFNVLDKAYRDNTNVIFWFANGDKNETTSRGFCANFNVTDFSESQELENAVTFSVTLDIDGSVPTPGYYTGAAEGGELALVTTA